MNPYLKIKSWYKNKIFILRWKRGLRKSMIKTYGKTPSRITKILSAICSFWKEHWKVLLPIIVGSIVALFIHFDSKSTTKTQQDKNQEVSTINHKNSK